MDAAAHVEQREGGYWVASTRVSLDSLVYAFLSGQTAESIAQSFPVLDLEQVYGALTFYLANRATIDGCLRESRTEYERLREAAHRVDPTFYQKLATSEPEEWTNRICYLSF